MYGEVGEEDDEVFFYSYDEVRVVFEAVSNYFYVVFYFEVFSKFLGREF